MCLNHSAHCVYQEIAATTQTMLAHAKANRWDHVIELVTQYQESVDKLKTLGPLNLKELEERRHILSEILDNDAAIRRLASPELDRLNNLISGLQRQRTVLKAYYAPQS